MCWSAPNRSDAGLLTGSVVQLRFAVPTRPTMLEAQAAVRFEQRFRQGFELVSLTEAELLAIPPVLQRTGDSVGHTASLFLKGSSSQTGQAHPTYRSWGAPGESSCTATKPRTTQPGSSRRNSAASVGFWPFLESHLAVRIVALRQTWGVSKSDIQALISYIRAVADPPYLSGGVEYAKN